MRSIRDGAGRRIASRLHVKAARNREAQPHAREDRNLTAVRIHLPEPTRRPRAGWGN